jgi:hypothetical protein
MLLLRRLLLQQQQHSRLRCAVALIIGAEIVELPM